MGGPCGQPIKFPNSKVKRGWSTTKVRWRIEAGMEPDPVTTCGGERYELRSEEGRNGRTILYYVHSPLPDPPPPEPRVMNPLILHAIGGQRYWLAQLDKRKP